MVITEYDHSVIVKSMCMFYILSASEEARSEAVRGGAFHSTAT